MKRSALSLPLFETYKKYASFVFLTVFYFAGLITGAFSKNFIGNQTEIELFQGFISVVSATKNYGFIKVFVSSAITELLFYITVFVFGLSIAGIPFICLIMMFKGFTVGFFIAFVSGVYGVSGLVAVIIAILPGLFLSVVLLLVFCNRALEFSFAMSTINSKGERVRFERPSVPSLYRTGIFMYLLSLTGILYETLVCPLVISLIST